MRLILTCTSLADEGGRFASDRPCLLEALASTQAQSAPAGLPQGVTHGLNRDADKVPWLARVGTRGGAPLTATRDLTGPWQPMAHGARFDVRLTAEGAGCGSAASTPTSNTQIQTLHNVEIMLIFIL